VSNACSPSYTDVTGVAYTRTYARAIFMPNSTGDAVRAVPANQEDEVIAEILYILSSA